MTADEGHAGNHRSEPAPAPTPRPTAAPGDLLREARAGEPAPVMAAEGRPSAPSNPAVGDQRVWTPERQAIVRRDYPAGIAIDDILRAVNALPGKPIHRDRIAIQASKMHLRRPANAPTAATSMLLAAPAAIAPASPIGGMWTPERDAIVVSDIPGGVPTRDILSDLNMLPGPPIERRDLFDRAAALGVSRPA